MSPQRSKRRHASDPSENDSSPPEDDHEALDRRGRRAGPRTRRARWFRRLLLASFALVILAWFAPTLILGTPLRDAVLRRYAPELAGQLTVASVHAGWLSPVRIENVVVHPTGHKQPLAKASGIETERSLLSLLCSPSSLGTIRIEQPVVHLELRSDGSNLEDFLAPWQKADSEPSQLPNVTVAWEDGSVELIDERGRKTIAASANSGQFQCQAPQGQATELPAFVFEFAGAVTSLAETGAPIEGRLEAKGEIADSQFRRGTSSLKTERVSLASLESLWRRIAPQTRVAAVVTTACRLDWDLPTGGAVSIEKLEAADVKLRAAEFLGPDTLHIPELVGVGELKWNDAEIRLKDVQLVSDLATVRATGALDLQQVRAATVFGALSQAAGNEQYDIHAEVNLAALAGTLPHVLKIRENTQIATGSVEVSLRSHSELNPETQARERQYVGSLQTSDLSAIQDGRHITWKEPIAVSFAARQSDAAGAVIDKLVCESSFLHCQGRGTLEQGELTASCNLDQLTAELSRFVEVQGWQLKGQANAELQWQTAMARQIAADGRITFDRLQVKVPNWDAFAEDQLTTTFAADLQLDPQADSPRVAVIERATARVVSGQDLLELHLLKPVSLEQGNWPVDLTLQGNLASWKARCQPVFTLPGVRLAGTVNLSAQGEWSAAGVTLAASQGEVQNLEFENAAVRIREPRVTFDASGRWQHAARRWDGGPSTLASSSLALRCDDLQWDAAQQQLSGEVGYRADLERLQQYLKEAPSVRARGSAEGYVHLEARPGGVIAMDGEHTITPFEILTSNPPAGSVRPASTTAPNIVWHEPELVVKAKGTVDAANRHVTLDSSSVQASTIQAELQGVVELPNATVTVPRVNLDGKLTYDLAVLAQPMREALGPGFQVRGKETRPFHLEGPLLTVSSATSSNNELAMLVPRALRGSASLGWEQIVFGGITLGKGELDAELREGVVDFVPLEAVLSQGRLRLEPRVELTSSPQLRLAKGRVVDQMQITPEMCQTWLKYVNPLLADATRAQGTFSTDLVRDARVPLGQPRQATIDGMLTIHGGQVGPGPLAQQLLTFVDQLRSIVQRRPLGESRTPSAWVILPQQQIACQLTQGRVHHRGLAMQTRDVVVRTSGSVGLDQSLSLVAEITIPDSWVANDRLLASLRGQVIRVPVTGSVQKPRLDTRVLDDLARQMAKSAATNLLDDQLRRIFE